MRLPPTEVTWAPDQGHIYTYTVVFPCLSVVAEVKPGPVFLRLKANPYNALTTQAQGRKERAMFFGRHQVPGILPKVTQTVHQRLRPWSA